MYTDEGPSTDSCLGDDFRAARCICLRLIVSQDCTSRGDGRSFFHNHLFRKQIVDDHESRRSLRSWHHGVDERLLGARKREPTKQEGGRWWISIGGGVSDAPDARRLP